LRAVGGDPTAEDWNLLNGKIKERAGEATKNTKLKK
jgi:uncharacterized protein YjbJ (UPF0337 family)